MLMLRTIGLVLLACLVAPRVEAQTCHTPDLRDHHVSELPFRATAALLAANYEREGYRGDYQGLYGTFAYRSPWWGAEVMLPAYRLNRREGTEYGLGDMMLTLRGTFFRAWDGDLSLGVELPVMLPTGDDERGLGMGHVMPMPDVFFSLRWRPLLLLAQVGYGHMIGDMKMHAAPAAAGEHEHHHEGAAAATGHTMQSSLVNPMNDSELEHSLQLALGLRRELFVHARWWGAVPIDDSMGVLRQAVAAGATATLSVFDLTLELQKAIAGNAFDWKGVLQLGANF